MSFAAMSEDAAQRSIRTFLFQEALVKKFAGKARKSE
jgi:hypothetical protein